MFEIRHGKSLKILGNLKKCLEITFWERGVKGLTLALKSDQTEAENLWIALAIFGNLEKSLEIFLGMRQSLAVYENNKKS